MGDGPSPAEDDHIRETVRRGATDVEPYVRGRAYIDTLVEALAPSTPEAVTQQARSLFNHAHRQNMLKGRGSEPVAAACVYLACRVTGATVEPDGSGSRYNRARNPDRDGGPRPLTLGQLAAVAPDPPHDSSVRELHLRELVDDFRAEIDLPLPVRDATDYLPGLLEEFEVSAATAARARTLIGRAQEARIGAAAGRHPEAVAAAALLVAVDDDGPRRRGHIPPARWPRPSSRAGTRFGTGARTSGS